MSSIISDLFSLFFMIIIGYFTYITFFKKELTPAEKREIAKVREDREREIVEQREIAKVRADREREIEQRENCKSKRRQ
jgi:hypothetical protein